MSSTPNSESADLNAEICLNLISKMKQFYEATMKLRLELAEMQIKVLSLYEAPCLDLLQLLMEAPESCQMDHITENN